MRRKIALVAATLFAIIGVSSGAAEAASIEPTPGVQTPSGDIVVQPESIGQCGAGEFCIWTISLSRGAFYKVTASVSDFRNYDGGGVYKNNGSYWNRTGKNWCLYSGVGYTNQIGKIYGSDTQSYDFSSSTANNLASMKVC